MAKHIEDGKIGEQLAVDHLRNVGYEIVYQNWRFQHLEVDVIAKEKGVLVFVEVKSRNTVVHGEPHEFVDYHKQKSLIRAADIYLAASKFDGEIRFDIVAVYLKDNRIEIIKDAFWSS